MYSDKTQNCVMRFNIFNISFSKMLTLQGQGK